MNTHAHVQFGLSNLDQNIPKWCYLLKPIDFQGEGAGTPWLAEGACTAGSQQQADRHPCPQQGCRPPDTSRKARVFAAEHTSLSVVMADFLFSVSPKKGLVNGFSTDVSVPVLLF